jgi:hypothetical protein
MSNALSVVIVTSTNNITEFRLKRAQTNWSTEVNFSVNHRPQLAEKMKISQ